MTPRRRCQRTLHRIFLANTPRRTSWDEVFFQGKGISGDVTYPSMKRSKEFPCNLFLARNRESGVKEHYFPPRRKGREKGRKYDKRPRRFLYELAERERGERKSDRFRDQNTVYTMKLSRAVFSAWRACKSAYRFVKARVTRLREFRRHIHVQYYIFFSTLLRKATVELDAMNLVNYFEGERA